VRVLGVDAWVKGWVGVELVDGEFAAAHSAAQLADLLSVDTYDAIAVDIPMGLLDKGFRTAERAARVELGARRSSVFATPPRPVLLEPAFDAANALSRELTGQGLSRQSFALGPRILEADSLYSAGSWPLFEVHPEVSFTMMGGGPPASSKKTWHSLQDRMGRLASAGIVVPGDLGAAAQAGADDVLDAAAAAWSAHRLAMGVGVSLPDPPQINERRQVSAIWF
jgi:predicted RNase H-like nuclease